MKLTTFEAEVRVVHSGGVSPFKVRYDGSVLSFGSQGTAITSELAQQIIDRLERVEISPESLKVVVESAVETAATAVLDKKLSKAPKKGAKAEAVAAPEETKVIDPMGLTADGSDPDKGAATVPDMLTSIAAKTAAVIAPNGYNGFVCAECGAPQRVVDGTAVCAEGHRSEGISDAAYRMREARIEVEKKQLSLPVAAVETARKPYVKPAIVREESAQDDPILPDRPNLDLVIMKAAKTLKDVVVYMLDHGVGTKDLVKVCESFKNDIPLLARMGEPLSARIPRVLLILGVGVDASAS